MTACAKLTASASAPRRPSRTSRRQVNNWPTDNPYLRAVADTSRGALALSATIRRFSSGVQRRRAPVWITSSRDTFDIVVCSVIRLCLRGFIPQRKAAVAGGLPAVSEHALIKRINRKLVHDGQKIKTASSLRAERDLGRYFVVDVHRNLVVDRDIRLKALGCELRVLGECRLS